MDPRDKPVGQPTLQQPASPVTPAPPKKSRRKLILIILVVLLLIGGGAWLIFGRDRQQTPAKATAKTTDNTPGLHLDTKKNYGDKYADGLLPVGDGKYSGDGAKKGYIYICSQYARSLGTGHGAGTRGPWFQNNNTEYDINKKARVAGSVTWPNSFSNTINDSTRTISTNDLPSHPTGVFPIAASDPAHTYDRNPNGIQSQTLTYSLNASPAYGDPSCMGGQAGVMLTGVALFNAFDADGRDGGAWEVQDSCDGHPQKTGEYHYHTLSSCIKDTSVRTVIGYALDGFPITGPKLGDKNILTTDDLDECHGITSEVMINGRAKTTYHYVMTEDFPYSVSCFRGQAIQPPGQP